MKKFFALLFGCGLMFGAIYYAGADILADKIAVSVRKGSAGMIAKGVPVSFKQYSSYAGTGYYVVEKADADDSTVGPAMGIMDGNISATDGAPCVLSGLVSGINTSAFTVGDILYVSTTAGALTATAPVSTNAKSQPCAIVIRKDAVNGAINVIAGGRRDNKSFNGYSSVEKAPGNIDIVFTLKSTAIGWYRYGKRR